MNKVNKSIKLIPDFVDVISHAPNIEEMLKDENFTPELLYDLYKQWMSAHYKTYYILNIDVFFKSFKKYVYKK